MNDEMIDADWMLATLQDVSAALEQLIDEVDAEPDQVASLLREQMPTVFAKLNYAWNSRFLGPAAVDQMDHDALVAWPKDAGL